MQLKSLKVGEKLQKVLFTASRYAEACGNSSMTFEIHSDITNRSMTVAARAMRRVLRRKRSIIWAIFGWTVFFINALLLIPFDGEPFALDVRTVTSLLVEVMLLSVLLFQDRFNGMIARKNTLAGTKEYHVAFGEDSYTVVTAATTSTFRYELIDALAESQDYIIFLMKKRYAQPSGQAHSYRRDGGGIQTIS